jgi:hypothetical protein
MTSMTIDRAISPSNEEAGAMVAPDQEAVQTYQLRLMSHQLSKRLESGQNLPVLAFRIDTERSRLEEQVPRILSRGWRSTECPQTIITSLKPP